MGRGWAEQGGDGGESGLGPGGGGFSSGAPQIQTSFLTLIHLHGSMQTFASNIICAGPGCPIAAASAYSGARGQMFPYPEEPSSNWKSPTGYSGSYSSIAALLCRDLGKIGLPSTWKVKPYSWDAPTTASCESLFPCVTRGISVELMSYELMSVEFLNGEWTGNRENMWPDAEQLAKVAECIFMWFVIQIWWPFSAQLLLESNAVSTSSISTKVICAF